MAQLPSDDALTPAQSFSHRPVMLDEIVEAFAPAPAGVLIDATLGGAGHSAALLAAHPHLQIVGLDRDGDAIAAATEVLNCYGRRSAIRKARFDEMAAVVTDVFPEVPVTGVLFDLGVSSHQLDVARRGFSYRSDGPLDMRMDRDTELTAAEVVNTYDESALTRVLRDGGEERFAHRIARAIVANRPLDRTAALAQVIRDAIPAPARRRPGDPAKRSFQAIRMEVNAELEVLESAIRTALDLIAPGGRCVTLAYHSGEDRLIKQLFGSSSTGGCSCPPALPCACGAEPHVRLITRGARKPTELELRANPRSQSARMRVAEILASGKRER